MSAGTQGPASLLGRVIGGYRLVRILGKGATGVVFLGERTDEARQMLEVTGRAAVLLPDQAAVKVLVLPWQLDDAERAEFRKRFLREARTLQTLDHPNILPVLISGEDEATDSSYMVLPYISGGTLHERLASQGPLPLAEAAALLTELASAVDDAHQHQVLHRDIKPGNILLDGHGHLYLADFSIARLLVETTTHLTKTGNALGTPIYMAPEALAGQPVGREADIYSLGMVLYEMVTGLRTTTPTTTPPAPARQLRPDLPMPAEAAILKALAKQPEQRFQTAGALARAFGEGLANRWTPELTTFGAGPASGRTDEPTLSTSGSLPLPPAPAFRRFRGRPLKTAALVALALVLVVGGALGGVLVHGGQASPPPGARAGAPQAHATHAATSISGGKPQPTARPAATAPTGGGSSGGQNPSGPSPAPTNPPASGPTATATATAVPTPTFTPPAPPTPTFTPVPPPPSKTIQIGWSSVHPTWIWMTFNNFPTSTYTYTCNFSTPPQSNAFTIVETTEPETWDNARTCFDAQHGDHVWVIVNGVQSNTLTVP